MSEGRPTMTGSKSCIPKPSPPVLPSQTRRITAINKMRCRMIVILPLMPTAAKFLADSSPDARVKIGELPGSVQLERIAGMGEGDVIDPSDSARPPREKDHALAERNRFAQVMRDKKNRLSVLRPDADQFLLQDQPGLGVQGAKRFVHQDNLRVVSQGANEGGALAHA